MNSVNKFTMAIGCTLAILSVNASRAELKMAQKPLPIYLAKNGVQVDAVEAIRKSIAGEKILKCELVEAQASATGNVSLKKVK